VTRALVLTALDLEARGLARHLGLGLVSGSSWAQFRAGSTEIVAVGIGAGHLEARCGSVARPDLVISAGVCGGLAPALRPGALVIPEAVLAPDGASRATAALPGLERRGTLVSTREMVTTPAAKARLYLTAGALAVDMESAAILDWAGARGWPAVIVRAVADPADRSLPHDLASAVDEDGRLHPLRAVRAALARPRAIPAALALRSGTEAALRNVAHVLAQIVGGPPWAGTTPRPHGP